MPTSVVSVRLDDELKARLDALSAVTGRSAASHVREALSAHLDELEYACRLSGEAEALRRGELDTMSSAELAAELFS